jgi:endonuclease/exonuclease/phosphatase family metal-dependent hydrolase
MNKYTVSSSQRITLTSPFKWPVRIANLKRCLLVQRMPLADGREFVLVNLHMEAYDSTGGRVAQTKELMDFLQNEYAKGNYCLAGGDFNQNFPNLLADVYGIRNPKLWVAGVMSPDLPPGWHYAYDSRTPSNRLNNQPYREGDPKTQYYLIDGYILSPNITVQSVTTLDLHFANSDHNPVLMTFTLDG